MGYLEDFKSYLDAGNDLGFMQLWEEYCASDVVDADEIVQILNFIKKSTHAEGFGKYAETTLTLWEKIENPEEAYKVLRAIVDLETSNSPELAELVTEELKKRFSGHKHFNEKLRLVGLLRKGDKFQGAISHFELLTHMDRGRFVYHTSGWGVGEIVDISLIREQLVLEFEAVPGKKELTFANAFNNLIPLSEQHFLARRFGNPDELEREAKEDPVKVIHLLLKDLGPKTAAEIKDELCELVIPEADWSKWWQLARTKIKKDTHIETPDSLREPFRLRHEEESHETRFKKAFEKLSNSLDILPLIYQYHRNHPEIFKTEVFRTFIEQQLKKLREQIALSHAQAIQVHLFLIDLIGKDPEFPIKSFIQKLEDIPGILEEIEIVALKKKFLAELEEYRADWIDLALKLFLLPASRSIRDYLLKELNKPKTLTLLTETVNRLKNNPSLCPEAFVWYFQKLLGKEAVPFNDAEGRCRFLEAFFSLFSHLEQFAESRELVKKMHAILTANRYAVIRTIFASASLEEIKEFLLLATKCSSLEDHEIKILQSLAEVVHPSLAKESKEKQQQAEAFIWTTQEGYQKVHQRVVEIGTKEIIQNAREIEEARAHGDLRENAEYKSALERRSRLQGELKTLSEQLKRSRILSKADIDTKTVSVGCIVELTNSKGEKTLYTLLGPWDADPDKLILSFQSRLAQAMLGCKVGDTFIYQNEQYLVSNIQPYL